MKVLTAAAGLAALFACTSAQAEELTNKVYPATLEPGLTELELRYGRLVGDEAGGEDGLLVEVAHHFSKRFYGSLILDTTREPGEDRRIEGVGVEGIMTLGQIAGIDTALYGEYGVNRRGPDVLETKLLLQKRAGKFDARLNLIAEKDLERGEPMEFGYAASVDREIADEFRLGLMGMGELGSTKRLTSKGEHFLGPIAKYEIEHLSSRGELEFEAGYLFPIGEARRESDGQLRFQIEYGFRF